MKKNIISIIMVVCGWASFAQPQVDYIQTVSGRDQDKNYRTAVYEALVQALSKVKGMTVEDSREVARDSLNQLKTTKQGEDSVTETSESFKHNAVKNTKGRVKSWEIVSENRDAVTGEWDVVVTAKVFGQYDLGIPANTRRRMIVMPFRSLTTSPLSVFGRDISVVSTTCETIARQLSEDITQTRRFTMLERDFDKEIQAELNRINLENASSDDLGRLKQLLVTDYMVVGTVKMFSSSAPVYNKYTGRTSMPDSPFLEVKYKVILVPTGQLKWADTVVVPYSACRGNDVDVAISTGMAVASSKICHQIVDNIYPVRVTEKTTFELVLNMGGKNMLVGQIYDVFRLVREVVNVANEEETLGASEEKVATIRITRVTPKMSYAVGVDGTPINNIEIGSIVRRAASSGDMGGAAGLVSPVQTSPDGTVKVPWKK